MKGKGLISGLAADDQLEAFVGLQRLELASFHFFGMLNFAALDYSAIPFSISCLDLLFRADQDIPFE